MIVKFSDLRILQLALMSGAIPAEVAGKPAVAVYGADEQLWVESSVKLPAAAQRELKRLGAVIGKSADGEVRSEVSCWPELLPLVADDLPLDALERTPVLFEMRDGDALARLVLEMLRLGNDRQSFRWLEDGRGRWRSRSEESRALLRVVGPPYYSLLWAVDQLGGPGAAPCAFVESVAGVWVELGYRHPLAANIRPPKGKILLLRPPRLWTPIADAPFRDVYEAIEFQVADGGTSWRDRPLTERLHVTPRLRQAGPADGAELWVLRGEAIDELNRFVQNAEDQLLARLMFAVGEKEGRKIVVLRVRPSKLPPPIVVLPAEAYKSYLKIHNLFVPAGCILHPPLRRDVVRKLLAEDVDCITWLVQAADGSFTPESLPDNVFRPLTDWVDYVLDRDREMLQAWMQAMHFDFEPFVCDEEEPSKPKKPPTADKSRQRKSGRSDVPTANDTGEETAFAANDERKEETEEEALLEAFAAVEEAEPSELQKQLSAVEGEFLALPGTLDDDDHRVLWPRLADLNLRLNRREDAGICWLNALWQPSESAEHIDEWTTAWFRGEALTATANSLAAKPSWIAPVAQAQGGRAVSGGDLDHLLGEDEPATADVRALAAYLVWAARRNPHPTPLTQRLQAVQRFLEKHERLLPVRACWLAWYHLAEMLDDVLALARARDRLLERLFHHGLRPDQDLPGFLRSPGRQRFNDVREWLKRLCEKARDWIDSNKDILDRKIPNKAYADLLFAFGLARLGENDDAKQLLRRAVTVLRGDNPVHRFLVSAFEARIGAVLDGQAHAGALPAASLKELEAMPQLERYVVERVRHNSRILEPDRQLDPYRHWAAQMSGLDKALVDLSDLPDRSQVQARLLTLLRNTSRGRDGCEDRAKIVRAALELGPHLGEDFTRQMLDQALPVFNALPPPQDAVGMEGRAKFLEKALFAAAHFGRGEHVRPLVARFRDLLQSQRESQSIDSAATLVEQALRSLRKLGMRDDIDWLLQKLADLILHNKDVDALARSVESKSDALAPLIALLHVAGSWYYFGRDHLAEPVVQAARTLLFRGKLTQAKQQRDLACAYARTVGQAPPAIAQARLEEIFVQLKGYRDTFTTSSYFSVIQMDLLEAVILAAVSDDFTQGTQTRRWLDDDEFLVRRRIHDDRRKMTSRERD